jgi:outer membrane protein TolC
MHLIRLAIIAGTIMLAAAVSTLSGAESFSLDQCIDLALQNNPTIIKSKEAVNQAASGVTVSRSSFFPQINASSGYSKSGDGVSSESYSSGLSLQQSLFQGGSNIASVKAASAQSEIALQNLKLVENQIVESVKSGFFSVIQEHEQLALADSVLKRRNDDLVLIRLRYKAGIESDPAVSEAEANVVQAEYQKMSSEEGLRLAKISLNLLMGREREAPIEIEATTPSVSFPLRSDAVEMALSTRPEMAAEAARLDLEKASLSQSRSGFLPSLDLNASLNRRGDEFLAGENSWSAGVSLGLPIFNGFRTTADYSRSRAALRGEIAQLQETRQSIEQDVEEAYSAWLLAKKNLEVAEKNLSAEIDMYNLTRLDYRQGRSTYFIFQQRESSLTGAEYQRASASYNLLVATAKLERAMGWPSAVKPKGGK